MPNFIACLGFPGNSIESLYGGHSVLFNTGYGRYQNPTTAYHRAQKAGKIVIRRIILFLIPFIDKGIRDKLNENWVAHTHTIVGFWLFFQWKWMRVYRFVRPNHINQILRWTHFQIQYQEQPKRPKVESYIPIEQLNSRYFLKITFVCEFLDVKPGWVLPIMRNFQEMAGTTDRVNKETGCWRITRRIKSGARQDARLG